jgi:hypothetical protein
MPLGNDWNLQTHNVSEKEQTIEKATNKLLGHRFRTLSHKIASVFSLYNFLKLRKNTDPAKLHITDENYKPMFSLNDLKEIQKTVRRQTSQPMTNNNTRQIINQVKHVYAPILTQSPTKGGGAPSTPPIISLKDPSSPDYDPKDNVLGVTQRPGFEDKTPHTFFDRLFEKLGNTYNNSPIALKFSHKWDGVFWFMFLLYNLENVEIFGPFLSVGLDAYTVGVRMAVEAIHETIPGILSTLGSILPIGVGGIAGDFLGEGIATVIGGFLLMGSILVSMSRKHFGDAFKASLEIIPLVGDFLLTFAMSMETNLDRMNGYRNKLINQLNPISPRLYSFVDYWVPKLEPVPPGPAPPVPTIDDIKEDIVHKGMEATGANKALEKVTAVTENPMGAVANQLPAMPSLPAVPNMPTLPTVPKMPNMPAVPNMPTVPTVPKMPNMPAVPTLPNMSTAKRGGGTRKKRTRRYKRHKHRHTNRRR